MCQVGYMLENMLVNGATQIKIKLYLSLDQLRYACLRLEAKAH
jgi:hypothetical protein